MTNTSGLSNVLLTMLTFLLFDGCDKSKDPEPLPCLLTSWEFTGNQYNTNLNQMQSFTVTYAYVYDNQKVVSSTETSKLANEAPSSATYAYSYNKSGDLSEIRLPDYREVFTYTGGDITKKEMLNNANELEDQTDYEYSNGRLSKIQDYSVSAGSTTLAKEAYVTFEYATSTDKNPVRAKYFSSPSNTTPYLAYEYTFSDQKTEFAAVPAAFYKYLKLNGAAYENTVTKILVTYPNGNQTHTYTYEFNADGFPTKQTDAYTGATFLETTTYVYNCN